MIKSIRTRLTAWYALTLSIILLLFCLVLYFSISYVLNRQVNHSLQKQAHNFADSYLAELNGFHNLPEQDFLTDPLLWFRIVKRNGSLFRPAPAFNIINQTFPYQEAKTLSTETSIFETFTLNNQSFRSIIFPIDIVSERVGWIQLVKPISDITRTLQTIQTFMFILVPIAVLLLSIGGNFLARKTLGPIENVRQQVDDIYDQNLSQRIKVINPQDELGSLTQTFNQMLERLQQAFESQQRFLADASHEIKTPITILRSQWEKMLEEKALPVHFKKEIQNDLEDLVRLAELVDNLLLLSSIDEKSIKIEQKPVDLADVLQEVYEDGKILAEHKHQNINFDYQTTATISGDRSRLVQLFLNLIDNAVKYTDERGGISLFLFKTNNTTHVEIRDTGIGISEKDLVHIFNRFYRADKSRSRQLGGSGLGLSICQWIVNAHHGKIKIQSEINKGTKVSIEFAHI
jgi:heavy metal sensor kinase